MSLERYAKSPKTGLFVQMIFQVDIKKKHASFDYFRLERKRSLVKASCNSMEPSVYTSARKCVAGLKRVNRYLITIFVYGIRVLARQGVGNLNYSLQMVPRRWNNDTPYPN